MTTTAAAIRDAMLTVVEALTPAIESGTKFRRFREQMEFREWAEAHPAECLRRFSVRSTGPVTPPSVTNTDVEWVESDFECAVAYPANLRFGSVTELDDVIELDLRKLEHTIGTNGYAYFAQQTAGATVTTIEAARETVGPVTYGVLRLHAGWYRVMP